MQNTKRIKRIHVTSDLLLKQWSNGEHHFIVHNMPEDAELIATRLGEPWERPGTLYMYIQSNTFDEVSDMEEVPIFEIEVSGVYKVG